MRFVFCGLALLSLALLITTAAASSQSLTPAPGPHAVGLHIVKQYDASRDGTPALAIFDDGKPATAARPMQTLVWYPALASGGSHVRYLDYLQSGLTGDDFALAGTALADASKAWTAQSAAKATMLAVRDAPAAA